MEARAPLPNLGSSDGPSDIFSVLPLALGFPGTTFLWTVPLGKVSGIIDLAHAPDTSPIPEIQVPDLGLGASQRFRGT